MATTAAAGPAAASAAAASAAATPIRVPVAERVANRRFRYVHLEHNGVRAVVVHDPSAAFGAVAAVVQAGYLSDGSAAAPTPAATTPTLTTTPPLPLHGLAHYLEHAVHLGSSTFPDERDYKEHLAKHGGSSNASTSAATTRYHARCAASGLEGAVGRLGAALAQPLLRPESLAREVDNVHAEYSRNRNSDARRNLQLRRSALGPPLSGFSTGSVETLRDAPQQQGVDLPAAMRALWREVYVGPAVTAAVVGPQPVEALEAMVRQAFGAVRRQREEEDEEAEEQGAAPSAPLYTSPALPAGAPPGTLAASCFPRESMARLVRVAPMRELRQLELTWHIPFSSLGEEATAATTTAASASVAPWGWAAHVLGHEAVGSAAELLKRQGLITALTAGVGEDVRLSSASALLREQQQEEQQQQKEQPPPSSPSPPPPPPPRDTGLMTWHVSVDLTAKGDACPMHVAATIHRAVELLRRAPESEWRRTWEHAARCAELRFEYRDRCEALRLAQGLASSAAHYRAEQLLAGPALYGGPFEAGSCRAFLDRLATPGALVVTHTSPAHRRPAAKRGGEEDQGIGAAENNGNGDGAQKEAGQDAPPPLETERWYGARHRTTPLPEEWLEAMRAYAAVDDEEKEKTSSQRAFAPAVFSPPRPGELFLPPPAPWALPQDLALREPQQPPPSAPPPSPPTTPTPSEPAILRRPELVHSSPGLHLWHALDAARFGVPKAQARLRLVTPATYASGPKAAISARLLTRILSDVLEPELYDAHVAGTGVDVSTELDGMSLTASGFSDVVPRLLERALQAARALTLPQVEARFPRFAGQLRRDLLNWRNSNPQHHAEYAAERFLQPGKHHAEELLRALVFGGEGGGGGGGGDDVFAAAAAVEEEDDAGGETKKKLHQPLAVTPADVLALCRAVFGGGGEGDVARAPLHADALLYGNVSRDEAGAIAAMLEQQLAPPGITAAVAAAAEAEETKATPTTPSSSPSSLWPTLPVVDLSTVPAAARSAIRVPNPNPSNANHAMLMIAQVPPPPPVAVAEAGEGSAEATAATTEAAAAEAEADAHARQAALVDLFVQAAAKACFHELRTVRRLGYSVALYSASYGGGGRPLAPHAPAAVDAADDGDPPSCGPPSSSATAPHPIRHVQIRVQSPSTEPEALAAAAAEWLTSFRAVIQAMPDADLSSHKSSLSTRYLEPARSLADASSRCWRPIRSFRRDFAWRERKAKAAAMLTRDDLLAFYDACLDPAKAATMVVMVKGGGGGAGGGGGGEEGVERSGGGGGGGSIRPPPLHAGARVF
jgi:secreted Zn-dependent insulinase-like peptidase